MLICFEKIDVKDQRLVKEKYQVPVAQHNISSREKADVCVRNGYDSYIIYTTKWSKYSWFVEITFTRLFYNFRDFFIIRLNWS